MKFSTATFVLLTGASFASATNTLRRAAQDNPPACISLDDEGEIDIDWTSSCTGASVMVDIAEAIGEIDGCSHNHRVEAKSLTGATSIGGAKQTLKQRCKDAREPCLDLDTFSDLPFANCTKSEIMSTLEDALDTGCRHNVRVEAMLLTEMSTTAEAKMVLQRICQLNLSPCLGPIESLVFQTLTCRREEIMDEIETMLLDIGCGHNSKQEALLLTGMSNIGDAKLELKGECLRNLVPCTSLAGITIINCDRKGIMRAIRNEIDDDCPHNANKELVMLTGAANFGEAKQYIDEMCNGVWDAVESTQFEDIDATNFQATDFITDYFRGGTFLNTETSNFQLNDDGTNPTGEYTISQRTLDVGANIDAFREDEAESTIMDSTVDKLNTCQNQVMMCCFGRDRQSGDDNGDCAAADDGGCEDANPNDNSDLCSADGIPYPEDSEGDIHCHGIAWAESRNDPTNRLRFNNLFYVSMYDHMYTRGYVQNALAPDSSIIPMCSCIEDMPIVSRADCTEVVVTLTVTLNFDDGTGLLIAAPDDDLEVQFEECTGAARNNDLSSHVQRLSNQRKISDDTKAVIDAVIIGTCPA